MARRQRDDLRTSVRKKRVGDDQQCAAGLLHEAREGRIDLATGANAKDFDWNPKNRSARLEVFNSGVGKRSIGPDERNEAAGSGRQLTQHSEVFWNKLYKLETYASGVAARPIEARYQFQRNRISGDGKHNRNARGRSFGRERRWRAGRRGNHCQPPTDQIRSQVWQPIILALRPPEFDCYILTFYIARLG